MVHPHADYEIDPEWADLFGRQSRSERSVLDTLRDVSIFALLSPSDLERLARVVHVRHYAPGETVVRAGVPQSGIYVIRSGSVEILRRAIDRTAETVGVLGPGEILGEFGLVDSTPRSSTLVAAEPSELIGFFKPDLMDIMNTQPMVGCRILLRLGAVMTQALNRDYAALRACGYPWPGDPDPAVELGAEA